MRTSFIGVLVFTFASLAVGTDESPFWGRIYLRHGIAPIQYFRDSYGGNIPLEECEFVTPANNFGCSKFSEDDLALVTNSSLVVLDRGVCSFEEKSKNVQAAGAAGLIIVSDTEEVVRPVAHIDKGEIDIPTVMVRKSGGDQIRVAANREAVFGKLIPMICPKSICRPFVPRDSEYMSSSVRGGFIYSPDTKTSEWEFLASTFGSPLLTQHLPVVQANPQHACSELTNDVANHIVIIFGHNANCSFLTQISNAQVAGAASVLFVQGENEALIRPSVAEQWAAYNITIPSGMVSKKTAREILRNDIHVVLQEDANVANAWEAIAQLSDVGSWPKRKNRRNAFLVDLLKRHGHTLARKLAIRSHFINVVGGSKVAWDAIEDQVKVSRHDEL
ncbi:hypothetical protein Ae201684P_011193 [Aphanomyces euteiches]|uniref:PA domain-containing protein n=1 Tax=Aphanomyces euteiches TaxID=100861 RepID=A0A6G0XYS4_9STRA|nr:hypothetical protein Ae201684_000192 [Aphanomyces euteiches]KAH9091649.1 hypothetical protein Ae201684P_011193 [Aphanomyces euteiches]KAH9156574.1 hypothetical protein AeRB84_001524 [Aphanomyces euteiches]